MDLILYCPCLWCGSFCDYVWSVVNESESMFVYVCLHLRSPVTRQWGVRKFFILLILVDHHCLRDRIMMFNATFNNISVISWKSVLLVEQSGVPGEIHRPAAGHWQTLSYSVVPSTPRHERDSNSHRWPSLFKLSFNINLIRIRCLLYLVSSSLDCFNIFLTIWPM